MATICCARPFPARARGARLRRRCAASATGTRSARPRRTSSTAWPSQCPARRPPLSADASRDPPRSRDATSAHSASMRGRGVGPSASICKVGPRDAASSSTPIRLLPSTVRSPRVTRNRRAEPRGRLTNRAAARACSPRALRTTTSRRDRQSRLPALQQIRGHPHGALAVLPHRARDLVQICGLAAASPASAASAG